MRLSLAGCDFERAIFLTDRPISIRGAETMQVPTIADRADYSRRMLQQMCDFVQTEFALVIQWDGYVLNPDAWDDTFLEYDYIGARWVFDDGKNVGNGGFSLRSRRLLEILKSAHANTIGAENENEDEAICRRLRPWLEREHAVRFAPEPIADRFSIERVGINPRPFGFHGLFNMAGLVSDEELDKFCAHIPEGAWRSHEFFEFVVHLDATGHAVAAKRLSDWIAIRIGVPKRDRALEAARSLVKRYESIRQVPART